MQVGARGPDLHGVREGRGVAVWLLVEDGVDLLRAGRHLGRLLEAPFLLREVLQVPQLLEEAPFGVDANFLGEGLGDVHGLPARGLGRELAVGIDEAGVLQALPVDLCALGGKWLRQVLQGGWRLRLVGGVVGGVSARVGSVFACGGLYEGYSRHKRP